jgi:hypothetical protein
LEKELPMKRSPSADLRLTCRSLDVPLFLALGLAPVGHRGLVADLEARDVREDLFAARCRIAASGVPFYGTSLVSRDAVPVLFAAAHRTHLEGSIETSREPLPAFWLAAYPGSREIRLSPAFYNLLGSALKALPDPRPWPLLPAKNGRAVPTFFPPLP